MIVCTQVGGLVSVVCSPSGVQSKAPARNVFWCNLKATERSFLPMLLVRQQCGGIAKVGGIAPCRNVKPPLPVTQVL